MLALDPSNQTAFSALQDDVKEIRFVPHTVKAGETLATIAERYYGDRTRSEVIWETNQLPPNPRLTAGMLLKIPEIPGVPFVLPELRPRPPPETVARPDAPITEPARPGTETVEINPLLVGARESLEKGEYQVALADVDRVLAGNAQNPDAAELKKAVLYGLGKSQLGQRKFDDSVRTLTQLARLAPNYQDSPALLQPGAGARGPAALRPGPSALPRGEARGRHRAVEGGARVRAGAREREEEHRPGRTAAEEPAAAAATEETVA